MPPRQTRSKSIKQEASTTPKETAIPSPALRVVLLPKTALKKEVDNDEGDASSHSVSRVIKLRSPKNGNPELFIFDELQGKIYQMSCFKEIPRSWFVNDRVSQDGSMNLITAIDPLFLILPYLKKSNMFCPLEQIILDEEFPECSNLLSCKDLEQRIHLIADVKELKDIRAYRFSIEKCTDWLHIKLKKVQRELREREVHVTSGSQAATFVRNKKEKMASEEDYQKYAHGIISEFIPKEMSDVLLQHIGLSSSAEVEEPPEDLIEPPAKRVKASNTEAGPIEDYSLGVSSWGPTEKKKLTTAQKALNKVDKTGMKEISSFFGKKRTK